MPLKKQSETAREYLRLREELKKLDVHYFLCEYEHLQGESSNLEKKLEIVSSDYKEKQNQFEQVKLKYEQMERELEQKDCILEKNKNIISEKRIHQEQMEGDIKVCHEQILAAKQNDKHYQERVNAVKDDIQRKQKEKESCRNEEKELFANMSDMVAQKKNIEEELQACKAEMDRIGEIIDACNGPIMEQ